VEDLLLSLQLRLSLLSRLPFCLSFRSEAEESAVALASAILREEDLFLFVAFTFFPSKNNPKIACQVPKSTNLLRINNIRVEI
jgi:hypothetical protein